MNKTLVFVLVWSAFCFSFTMAVSSLNLASILAVLAEFWLTTVGVDLATGD